MAIGKRLTEPLKVVSILCDTALDTSPPNGTPILDYERTRDPKLVKARAGEQVTWFTLQPLPGESQAIVKSYDSPQREYAAFQIGCVACSDPDLLAWESVRDRKIITKESLDKVPDQLWHELGFLVLRMGTLSVGEEPRYGLPAGLPATRRPPSNTIAESAGGSVA